MWAAVGYYRVRGSLMLIDMLIKRRAIPSAVISFLQGMLMGSFPSRSMKANAASFPFFILGKGMEIHRDVLLVSFWNRKWSQQPRLLILGVLSPSTSSAVPHVAVNVLSPSRPVVSCLHEMMCFYFVQGARWRPGHAFPSGDGRVG